jgi:hypothetical protein
MFVPPEQRGSWYPPRPDDRKTKRGENVLLILIGVFLFSLLLAPIGGGTVVQAITALLAR